MLKILISSFLLVGCVSTKEPSKTELVEKTQKRQPKYKVGDCLMIVDLPNGETNSRHRIKIESVGTSRYYYRWLLDNGQWDKRLSGAVGQFDVLEKISKKVNDCPLSIPIARR